MEAYREIENGKERTRVKVEGKDKEDRWGIEWRKRANGERE